ncbi:hypothetical protein BDR03DRAFT_962328 [Suillus americanus]|nr:hypothetical protein BDR03DRAFT_962328 [Suillus americanus]
MTAPFRSSYSSILRNMTILPRLLSLSVAVTPLCSRYYSRLSPFIYPTPTCSQPSPPCARPFEPSRSDPHILRLHGPLPKASFCKVHSLTFSDAEHLLSRCYSQISKQSFRS